MSLLEALQELSPDSSKTTLRSWIKEGRVLLQERSLDRADHRLYPGEIVTLGRKVQFIRGDIRILFEDQDVIVLEKPAGLLSVATDSGSAPSVHEILKRRKSAGRVYPVHRLDQATSGVMIFALSEKAMRSFKAQFEGRLVEKTYYAIVENPLVEEKGTWECFLEEDDFYFVKETQSSRGKQAITHFQTLKNHKNFAFLRLKPVTGRKNQLRVQCANAGHPILGDKKYGATQDPLHRMCLHAKEITFTHPVTEKRMQFSVSLPDAFYKLFPDVVCE